MTLRARGISDYERARTANAKTAAGLMRRCRRWCAAGPTRHQVNNGRRAIASFRTLPGCRDAPSCVTQTFATRPPPPTTAPMIWSSAPHKRRMPATSWGHGIQETINSLNPLTAARRARVAETATQALWWTLRDQPAEPRSQPARGGRRQPLTAVSGMAQCAVHIGLRRLVHAAGGGQVAAGRRR